MKTRNILALLFLLGMTSCKIVEYYDYTHSPTHDLRQSLVWQRSSIKNVSKLTDEPVLLVPNLRTFTSSYPVPEAALFLCSDKPETILILRATLTNPATSRTASVELNEEVRIDKKGYNKKNPLMTRISLFENETMDYEQFKDAEELILEVHYRYPPSGEGSADRKQSFKLHLKKVKDIAYPT
jgi:hypothetical protein